MTKTPAQLDVDIRFLLANDRTLLAWVRTALAIEAGGLALIQFFPEHRILGIGLLFSGAVVALIGYSRYRAADRAIREHRLPNVGYGPTVEVALVVLIAVILGIAELTVLR